MNDIKYVSFCVLMFMSHKPLVRFAPNLARGFALLDNYLDIQATLGFQAIWLSYSAIALCVHI